MFQIYRVEFNEEGSFGTPVDDTGGCTFDNEATAEEACNQMNEDNFWPNEWFYSVREVQSCDIINT